MAKSRVYRIDCYSVFRKRHHSLRTNKEAERLVINMARVAAGTLMMTAKLKIDATVPKEAGPNSRPTIKVKKKLSPLTSKEPVVRIIPDLRSWLFIFSFSSL